MFLYINYYLGIVTIVHTAIDHQNHRSIIRYYIRQLNNIDFSSEVSTVHKFVYTDKALLLDRQ